MLYYNTYPASQHNHSHHFSSQRAPADEFLRQLRAAPGAWRPCLQLLAAPGLGAGEALFLAASAKASAQRGPEALDPSTCAEMRTLLAAALAAATGRGMWAVAAQLALALASALVRCPAVAPAAVVPEAVALLLPSAAAAAAPSTAGVGGDPAAAAAAAQLTAAVRQGAGAAAAGAAALLCLLAALPEGAAGRECLVAADRRPAAAAALRASPLPARLLCAALRARAPGAVSLACRALQSWCAELGAPPPGLEADPEALEIATVALMSGETHAAASDCLVALFDCCRAGGGGGGRRRGGGGGGRAGGGGNAAAPSHSGDSSGDSMGVNLVLPDASAAAAAGGEAGAASDPAAAAAAAAGQHAQLLEKLLGALETHLMPVVDAAAAASPSSSGGGGGGVAAAAAAAGAVGLGPAAEASFCAVLGAAAGALLAPALAAGGGRPLELLRRLQARLLEALGGADGGAVLSALLFWQNVYLASLQRLPRSDVLRLAGGAQRGALEALMGALVARTRLSPEAAARATADARDLPDDLRLVRGKRLIFFPGARAPSFEPPSTQRGASQTATLHALPA